MHNRAGCERPCAEPHPAERQADADQQKKWAERIACLRAVHQPKRNAGENRGHGHCGQRPLRLAFCIRPWGRGVRKPLASPLVCCAAGGQQKATKSQLLKKRRERHAKSKHHPRCARPAENLIDRRSGRAWQHHAVDDRQYKAKCNRAAQPDPCGECGARAPFHTGKETLVPERRK